MLFLDRTANVQPAPLLSTLQTRYQDANRDVEIAGALPVLVRFSGLSIAVLSVSTPAPIDLRPIAARSTNLPEAGTICARHKTHIIVAPMSDHADPLDTARALTAVAGAIAACCDGFIGALWDGTILTSAEWWAQMSPKAYNPFPDFPTLLWMRVQLARGTQPGTVELISEGLARFAEHELMITGPLDQRGRLVDKAFNLATYLIQHGNVIADGATVGQSEGERITIHHRRDPRYGDAVFLAATWS